MGTGMVIVMGVMFFMHKDMMMSHDKHEMKSEESKTAKGKPDENKVAPNKMDDDQAVPIKAEESNEKQPMKHKHNH